MTTVTGTPADEAAISEQEWTRILRRIADRKVIPVIGEHLTLMRLDDPARESSLAACLAARLGLPESPTSSLNQLAFRYIQAHPRATEDLYADICGSLPRGNHFPLPKPLLQLAEIRDFDLFVTTSFDPYLALAINEVRFGRRDSGSTRVLSYEGNRAVDIPERLTQLDYPIVYHLFGKAQAAPIFAVTDEDVLEHMHTLQAPECQPPNLFNALREQRILLIGTRLTGWLTRFFLRTSSADRLRDARRADYLVDQSASSDSDQTLFFEHFGEIKLLPMAPAHFVEELNRRWKASRPAAAGPATAAAPAVPPAGGREVFISYASEDLSVVKDLRERLGRELGVRVWFDKDSLRGGQAWEPQIADAIRGCAVFVPVVSAHVKSGEYRYVRAEWQEALRSMAGRSPDRPFVLPLAVDDTRPDDPAIEPGIRALHWRHLSDEGEMRRFLDEVRAGVCRPGQP
jgi:hypothetical protein